MYLVRQHYLDNYRDQLERWERERMTDVVCALDKLGRTPLGKAGNHTFRILRSIERMIDNLAYPGGPDLAHEQVRASLITIFSPLPMTGALPLSPPRNSATDFGRPGCRK